jgi:hypothetical protein
MASELTFSVNIANAVEDANNRVGWALRTFQMEVYHSIQA